MSHVLSPAVSIATREAAQPSGFLLRLRGRQRDLGADREVLPFAGEEDTTSPGFFDEVFFVTLPRAQFALVSHLRAVLSVVPTSVGTTHAFAGTAGADSATVDPPVLVAVTRHCSALPASVAVRA
jgi:hypothetical protein